MKVIRFVAVGVLLALAACSKPAATEKAAETPAAPAKPPLVTVNGNAASANELFEDYVKALTRSSPSSELSPEDREQIKENLVRIELIAQQAEKDGLAEGSGSRHAPRARAARTCCSRRRRRST